MSDEQKKPGWAFYTVAVVLLFVLYVASIGPAAWLHDREYIPDWALWVYLPLSPLAGVPVVERPISAYVDWWIPLPTVAPAPIAPAPPPLSTAP